MVFPTNNSTPHFVTGFTESNTHRNYSLRVQKYRNYSSSEWICICVKHNSISFWEQPSRKKCTYSSNSIKVLFKQNDGNAVSPIFLSNGISNGIWQFLRYLKKIPSYKYFCNPDAMTYCFFIQRTKYYMNFFLLVWIHKILFWNQT